jgi:hypothetical protein
LRKTDAPTLAARVERLEALLGLPAPTSVPSSSEVAALRAELAESKRREVRRGPGVMSGAL